MKNLGKKFKKITVYFKSSDGETMYKTERHRNGKVTCFCPGFVYVGWCWHSKRAKTYA